MNANPTKLSFSHKFDCKLLYSSRPFYVYYSNKNLVMMYYAGLRLHTNENFSNIQMSHNLVSL